MNAASTLAPANWSVALHARDRHSLAQEGFLLIRGAADTQAIQAMRAAWDHCMRQPTDVKRGNNDGPSHLEKEAAFQTCLQHPYVMSAVAQLLDGDVVLLGTRGRNPRHGSGQQGFHVDDATPVPPERQRIVNAFWMLDDMDESNGATRLIPRTHRLQRVPDKWLSQPDARHPQAKQICASSGDVLVFTAHLWHAGSKNNSGAPRRIAMAHFGRREVAEMRKSFTEMDAYG
jgi:ectoine hydroxylase-related dioxygenase (phytanoyl-CoA dioxygenase family)